LQAACTNDRKCFQIFQKPINVILFHKTKPVVLTAGVSGKVQLFKVDDILDGGNFLQNVQFSNYPITSMSFLQGGNSVVCGSSRQNYFMKYDLNKGAVSQLNLPTNVPNQNTGHFIVSYDGSLLAMVGHSSQVYVLSTLSMELVKTFSAPNNVTSLQFLPASNQELWAMTECGEVIIWDLKNSSQHMFRDEGAVSGTVVRLSSDGSKVASRPLALQMYSIANVRRSADPKPLLTASNLVTSCDSVAFSHDSQIMAFSSNVKKNQVRLLHIPSRTVFKNFPRKDGKMTNIKCMEFSPRSAYLAFGCSNGQLILDRINYYEYY
ncbi:hypothetical protein OESDEN_10018, partial [Oesophagostomum dentatum]